LNESASIHPRFTWRLMNLRLHRSTLLLVPLAIAVIITGAVITSTEAAPGHTQSVGTPVIDSTLHGALAILMSLFILAMAIWSSRKATPIWIRVVAWAGVATLVLNAAPSWSGSFLSPNVAFLHAVVSHLFLSLLIVIAIGTSSTWNRPPDLVDGSGKPFLRPLAIVTPPMVFLQITLGAAYRHGITSVMPHMAGAMAVAFLTLIVSSTVLQNFPRPAPLRYTAITLMSLGLIQVTLGIGTFLMILLDMPGDIYWVAVSGGHVLVGASTLAASVVLAMEVWRSVLP
jgi:hypothetical protein